MGSPKEYIQQKHSIKLMNKEEKVPEETHVLKNKEISINYVSTGDIRNKNNIIIDDINAFTVALEITRSDEDPELKTIK